MGYSGRAGRLVVLYLALAFARAASILKKASLVPACRVCAPFKKGAFGATRTACRASQRVFLQAHPHGLI